MKRLFMIISISLLTLSHIVATAQTGKFFRVTASGMTINITPVTALFYPNAGIKINTPGHAPGNCRPYTNGYCLFSVSDTEPAQITVSGNPGRIRFTLCLDGIGPMTCQQRYIIDASSTTLTSSVSSLALSVNNIMPPFFALTGHPRQITITNTGSATAQNVTYSTSPALPTGTSIAPASCGDIPPSGGTCVLTITPGPVALPDQNQSVGITLTVSGTNTNTLAPILYILTYGSIYQSGFVFSVDDTYANHPIDTSIGGTVAALVDQTKPNDPGFHWSSDNAVIYGIDEDSTTGTPSPNPGPPQPYATPAPGQMACDGNADGNCDTNNIVVYYANNPGPTFAASLCKTTIGGFDDWYLPAICEMGYDNSVLPMGSGCGIPPAFPTLQNMQTNLVENGDVGGLLGIYWSATLFAADTTTAWGQTFVASPSNMQANYIRPATNGVRCVRAMTP